jgi:hypothetical protein
MNVLLDANFYPPFFRGDEGFPVLKEQHGECCSDKFRDACRAAVRCFRQ